MIQLLKKEVSFVQPLMRNLVIVVIAINLIFGLVAGAAIVTYSLEVTVSQGHTLIVFDFETFETHEEIVVVNFPTAIFVASITPIALIWIVYFIETARTKKIKAEGATYDATPIHLNKSFWFNYWRYGGYCACSLSCAYYLDGERHVVFSKLFLCSPRDDIENLVPIVYVDSKKYYVEIFRKTG